MYIFGGFNSLLLSDIVKYVPESCAGYGNETACGQAGPGIRCVWNVSIQQCLPWGMATKHQQQKIIEECPSSSVVDQEKCEQTTDCHSCTANTNRCHWCTGADKCFSRQSNCSDDQACDPTQLHMSGLQSRCPAPDLRSQF
uniref:Uncharacterized protein n=2 Tax=Sphaerodactylus townsendi TaxID=933632 RepID=A0ACB8E8S7_9SAUR